MTTKHSRLRSHLLVEADTPPEVFGDALLAAMQAPVVGASRQPRRIRVADEAQAAEVRRVGPDIPVRVAEVPEIRHIMAQMGDAMGSSSSSPGGAGRWQEASHFDWSDDAGQLEDFFVAAQALCRAAPWTMLHDEQLLWLDIPALGVEGACVSIIGAAGESFGAVIFPSDDGYERLIATGERQAAGDPSPLGVAMLSLSFERGAELPRGLRRIVTGGRCPPRPRPDIGRGRARLCSALGMPPDCSLACGIHRVLTSGRAVQILD